LRPLAGEEKQRETKDSTFHWAVLPIESARVAELGVLKGVEQVLIYLPK
jgi:hypothetical protein